MRFMFAYLVGGLVMVLLMDILNHATKGEKITMGSLIFIGIVWPLVMIDLLLTVFGRGSAPISRWISEKGQKYLK